MDTPLSALVRFQSDCQRHRRTLLLLGVAGAIFVFSRVSAHRKEQREARERASTWYILQQLANPAPDMRERTVEVKTQRPDR